jgi:hypothetical protein
MYLPGRAAHHELVIDCDVCRVDVQHASQSMSSVQSMSMCDYACMYHCEQLSAMPSWEGSPHVAPLPLYDAYACLYIRIHTYISITSHSSGIDTLTHALPPHTPVT